MRRLSLEFSVLITIYQQFCFVLFCFLSSPGSSSNLSSYTVTDGAVSLSTSRSITGFLSVAYCHVFWQLDRRPFSGKIPYSYKNAFNPRTWNTFEIITADHEFIVRLWYSPPQRKKLDTDGFVIAQNENLIQTGEKGRAKRTTVPLEVKASVNSNRILGRFKCALCEFNLWWKMLRHYIMGAGICKF